MNYKQKITFALTSLLVGNQLVLSQVLAEEAHNFKTSTLSARQEIGTNYDCTPNSAGEVGHLGLVDEIIYSTSRKTQKEKANLSLDLSISLTSLGLSASQMSAITNQVKQIQNRSMGVPPTLEQFAEVAAKIKTIQPVLQIIRNGSLYASCTTTHSLQGWKLSAGRFYCSNSPVVANIYSNTLSMRFRGGEKEGVLECKNSQLQKFKPSIRKDDLIKLVLKDGSTKFQAIVKKLRKGH